MITERNDSKVVFVNCSVRYIILIGLLFPFTAISQLKVEGVYQGKNLYVLNPMEYDPITDAWGCVDSVFVNGKEVEFANESAFEIYMDSLGVLKGDEVEVIIYHHENCKPKILNPYPHNYPKPQFQVDTLYVDEEQQLHIRLSGKGQAFIFVEQYRWHKWMRVTEEFLINIPFDTIIDLKSTIHSGENEFRIVSIDHMRKRRPSASVYYSSHMPKEDFKYDRETKTITFDQESKYEIYDAYGNIVKKGVGSSVNCENLKIGAYYINYGNKHKKLIVRKTKKERLQEKNKKSTEEPNKIDY